MVFGTSCWNTTCDMRKNYEWNFFLRHKEMSLNLPKTRKIETDFRGTRTDQKTKMFRSTRRSRPTWKQDYDVFIIFANKYSNVNEPHISNRTFLYPFRLLFDNYMNFSWLSSQAPACTPRYGHDGVVDWVRRKPKINYVISTLKIRKIRKRIEPFNHDFLDKARVSPYGIHVHSRSSQHFQTYIYKIHVNMLLQNRYGVNVYVAKVKIMFWNSNHFFHPGQTIRGRCIHIPVT